MGAELLDAGSAAITDHQAIALGQAGSVPTNRYKVIGLAAGEWKIFPTLGGKCCRPARKFFRLAYKVVPAMESAVMQSGYEPLAGSTPARLSIQGSR